MMNPGLDFAGGGLPPVKKIKQYLTTAQLSDTNIPVMI